MKMNLQHPTHCIHRQHQQQQKATADQPRKCLGDDFGPRESQEQHKRKHVVIVMDALKDFTVETLEWVLKNIVLDASCSITLLGVKPWLTFVCKHILFYDSHKSLYLMVNRILQIM